MSPGLSKLSWYLNRLRAMPLEEIPYRLAQERRRSDLRRNGPGLRLDQIPGADVESKLRISIPPLTDDELIHWRSISEWAGSGKRNVFSILAAPERDFSKTHGDAASGIDWLRDPLSGKQWTPELSRNYRHQEELGEAKYVWELARMPWLLPRAVAARLLDDTSLARMVIDDVLDFVRANTPRTGADYESIHWQSGIELSFRIVGWTWSLALVDQLCRPTQHEWREIGLYITLAAEYLLLFESRFSSANNHLVAEGAGLEIAGRAWSWLPGAEKWAQRGAAILDDEIPRQILPDGFSAEMCTGYLLQVLEWSLAVGKIRADSDMQLPPTWEDRWAAAANLLDGMCHNNQPLPQLGDDDDAQVFPLEENKLQRINGLIQAMHRRAGQQAESSFLAHIIGTGKLKASTAAAPAPLYFSKPSGIAVFHAENSRLTFDCGRHGLPPLYAHAHCDALSVELSAFGLPVLIDPGTYCYHSHGPWRDWFRSTAAHNVLQIDVREQSQMLGPFMWGRVAKVEILLVEVGAITARHDGFKPFTVQRRVELSGPGDFLITDEAIFPRANSSEHHIQIFWHFAPGRVTVDSDFVTWQPPTASTFSCRMDISPDVAFKLEVMEGRESPPQGWHSPRFGEKIPAPTVVVSCSASRSMQFRTRIRIL